MPDIPDDFTTTTDLQVGTPIDSDLYNEDDIDVVRVNLVAGQRYLFDMLGRDTGFTLDDPQLLLFDGSGNILALDDDSGVGINARIDFVASQSGTFYLAAASGYSGGTYRLSMATAAPPVGDDFGQTPASAGQISVGAGRFGTINYDTDQDWFAVTLTAGATYRLEVRSNGTVPSANRLSDPVLSLFGANGALIDINDDADNSTTDAALIFAPQVTGTYYLAASGYNGATGNYLVSATVTADIPDTAATTATLAVGGSLQSTIDTGADADAIRVQLTAGQHYVIEMVGAATGGSPALHDPALALLDQAFNVLAANDDYNGGLNARIDFTATSSGTFYIGALSADEGVGGYVVSLRTSSTGSWRTSGDFNTDGNSDLLWQNANGAVSTWNVAGAHLTYSSFYAGVDPRWNVVETFDMNGDRRADILWRNSDGTVAVWQASGFEDRFTFNQNSFITASPGAAWKIAATGDINGDGRDDILWRNDDGSISAWSSTGSSFQQNSYFHQSVGAGWKVIGLADFNADGKDDILWRHDNGAMSEWLSTGNGFAENSYFDSSVQTSWHIDGLGDLNGDGREDIVWRNDSGALSTWLSNGAGFTKNVYSAAVGNDWQVAQVGDFNGDGRADILWHNANGAISVWQSNGNGFDQNTLYDAGAPTSWQIQSHDFLL